MHRMTGPGDTQHTGEFYWLRVTSFTAGATLAIDGQSSFVIDARVGYIAPVGKPWKKIEITGTAVVELGDFNGEPYPGTVAG